MSRRTWTDEQEVAILKEYQAGVGTKAILEKHGGTKTVLLRMVKRHGVVTQPGGRRHRQWSETDRAKMAELYSAGESQSAISSEFGTSQVVVGRLLAEAGVESRGWVRRGSAHPSWKGGVSITADGYALEKVTPDDPMFVMANRMGYVPQHRLVMARALGRPLETEETVHHVNGARADNQISNLQLRQGRHGKGVIMRCNHCGSTDVVAAPIED